MLYATRKDGSRAPSIAWERLDVVGTLTHRMTRQEEFDLNVNIETLHNNYSPSDNIYVHNIMGRICQRAFCCEKEWQRMIRNHF